MQNATKLKVLQSIIEDVDQELDDEEIIHLVLEKSVSKNIEKQSRAAQTFGQRAADSFAKFAGSWGFIIGFIVLLIGWIVVNVLLAASGRAFDSYPFILLNLVLSCVAAIQAPVIMMSQNRQEEKDRQRAENDYKVNLKTEIIIQDLHNKLDELLENQHKIIESRELSEKKENEA